jgi:hypothetical protein
MYTNILAKQARHTCYTSCMASSILIRPDLAVPAVAYIHDQIGPSQIGGPYQTRGLTPKSHQWLPRTKIIMAYRMANKNKKRPERRFFYFSSGGRCEIRTHGRLATSPVFKTGAFNRSANLPCRALYIPIKSLSGVVLKHIVWFEV